MIWKDGTTYSRDDKERVPSILRCKIGTLEIIVHRIHRLDGWYLTCRYLDIKDYTLSYKTLEDCQEQAVRIVKNTLYAKSQEITDNIIAIDLCIPEANKKE
jgi:hypothetical protein